MATKAAITVPYIVRTLWENVEKGNADYLC